MRHIHPVETYGLKFNMEGLSVSILTDTRYFEELARFYKTDLLIIAVVFYEPRPGIDHLSLPEVEALIRKIKPKKTILTHFGMTMLKAKPHVQAQALSERLGTEVVAASDGMVLDFP